MGSENTHEALRRLTRRLEEVSGGTRKREKIVEVEERETRSKAW
jgi:hypothetical protein